MSDVTKTRRRGEESNPLLDEAAATLEARLGTMMDGIRIQRAVVGVFFTGIKLSTGNAGVAYTPPESIERASTRILRSETFRWHDVDLRALIRGEIDRPFA